jgi:hypothetical protein
MIWNRGSQLGSKDEVDESARVMKKRFNRFQTFLSRERNSPYAGEEHEILVSTNTLLKFRNNYPLAALQTLQSEQW